jgi:hypothetical protein
LMSNPGRSRFDFVSGIDNPDILHVGRNENDFVL